MAPANEPTTFCPTSRQQWREWLHAHHATAPAVWLLYQKKQSGTVGITYAEAVEEALCFGWIDSRAQPVDAATYRQFFSRRKKNSGWSRVNKERVRRVVAAGLMTPAGLASIEAAQQNGSWALLDEVEELLVPADLARALHARPLAATYFAGLSRTDKRNLLHWLVLAKRPATRQRRLVEIAELASQGLKPKQFRGRPTASRRP